MPRLIVVGGSGVIGGAVVRVARAAGRAVLATASTRPGPGLVAFDMRAARLVSVVPDLGPGDIVAVLAGYGNPGWISGHQHEARALNRDASFRMADEVRTAGARLIFASTDQVFDGVAGGYDEAAQPNPLNLYGRLKVDVERHVLASGGLVARMGWTVPWDATSHCGVTQCYQALIAPNARMAEDNFINITDVDDVARGFLAMSAPTPPPSLIYHLVSHRGVGRSELAATVKEASRFGGQMAYERVSFSAIHYSEPRPVRAFMTGGRLTELGLSFTSPETVIRRKVALLDAARG